MLDKTTCQVAYAVLFFGGFLGMGHKDYPLPWLVLKYDTSQGGYVINMHKDKLKDASSIDTDSVLLDGRLWTRRRSPLRHHLNVDVTKGLLPLQSPRIQLWIRGLS